MVHQAQPSIHHTEEIEVEQPNIPAWSYLISPVIALIILLFMYYSYSQLLAY